MNYLNKPLSHYQKIMRNKSSKLFNHTATSHSKIMIRKLSLIIRKRKRISAKELLGNQKFKTTWSRLEWNKIVQL